jgi:hypothetical protein
MQWQKKLYQHEELPPPGIWDELKNTLKEEPYQLSESLFQFSETPPSEIWEKVSATVLTHEEEKPKVIIHNFRRTALSYAAAIIGTGLFISILVFLMNNKPDELGVKDLAAGLNFKDSQLIDDNKPDTAGNPAGIAIEKTKKISDQVSETPENKSTLTEKSPGITKNLADIQSPVPKSLPEKTHGRPVKKNSLSKNKVSYSDGNYILVYGPNGEYKRVSYKLADMVQSLQENGQSATSQNASTQHWSKVLSAWKEKVGQSTFIPSGTNFFDIAEMAEMLQSEK